MTHFAKVENGIVTNVIVAEQDVIDSGLFGDGWVQTSYNTYGNVHYAPSPPAQPMTPDGGTPVRANYAGIGYTYDNQHANGGTPLRKNFAGIGFTYDEQNDAFIPPKPYASWTLNQNTYLWDCPVARPTDSGRYTWNESTRTWDAIPETSGA